MTLETGEDSVGIVKLEAGVVLPRFKEGIGDLLNLLRIRTLAIAMGYEVIS